MVWCGWCDLGTLTGWVDGAVGGEGHGVLRRAAVEGEVDGLRGVSTLLDRGGGDEAGGQGKGSEKLHGVCGGVWCAVFYVGAWFRWEAW